MKTKLFSPLITLLLTVLSCTLLLVPWLSSCKENYNNATHKNPSSVLNRWEGDEPSTLDPHHTTGVWESAINRDLFSGLVTDAADAAIIPGAAQNWEVSKDALTYTFHLRKDGKWSDGTPLTAHDFVYSFQRILNPVTAARYANILYNIKNAEAVNSGKLQDLDKLGVKAIDDYTLQIRLEAPTPYFLAQLKHHTAYPVPKHVVEKFGKKWVAPEHIVCNGPYMLKEWKSHEYVHLVRNPLFYDADEVNLEEVYFHTIQDSAPALKRFRADELDMLASIPVDQYEWVKQNMKDELHQTSRFSSSFYVMNQRRETFQDRRVREALSLAVDRETLVDKVLAGGQVPAYSLVPPVTGYTPARLRFNDTPMPQRVIKAKQLLQEAGYGEGKPLRVEIRYINNEGSKKIAIALSSMWKQVGIESSLVNSEATIHYADIAEGNFDVAMAPWLGDYPDAQNFLMLLQYPNALNYGSYHNEEFNNLMQKASVTVDLPKRALLLQQAEQLALDEAAVIPMLFPIAKVLVSTRVHGFVGNSENIHASRWLSKE